MTKHFFLNLNPFCLASFLLLGLGYPSLAEETRGERVNSALIDRTNGFCRDVLPAMFDADMGMKDKTVRALVIDCYTGHARLAILGVKSRLSLVDLALSEVPAALIKAETGMNLDIYRPLAGRSIQSRRAEIKK